MSATIIWVDTTDATLYHLSPAGVTTEKVHHGRKNHHAESLGRNHSIAEGDEGKLHASLAAKLETVTSKEWLIVGPGMGRKHLANYLAEHSPNLIPFIKGNLALDAKLTENQIVAEGRKFFRHKHLFENI